MVERVIKIVAYIALAIYVLAGTFIGCQTVETLHQLEELLGR